MLPLLPLPPQGDIRANGVPLAQSRPSCGFVRQDDLFFPQLSVRETLTMAAELRMVGGSGQDGAQQRRATVDAIIARLGLAKVGAAAVAGGNASLPGPAWGKDTAVACFHTPTPRTPSFAHLPWRLCCARRWPTRQWETPRRVG